MERFNLVLLAEDEALIAVDLETALCEAGFDSRHVASGQEAIDELDRRHGEFCGLVTDIRLGDSVDGWAVARRARELIPGVPVVYMSGDSAHEHTIQGVPESVMLHKPFAVAQLTTALAMLVNAATQREPPPSR